MRAHISHVLLRLASACSGAVLLAEALRADGDADQGEARAGALLRSPEQAVTMARMAVCHLSRRDAKTVCCEGILL